MANTVNKVLNVAKGEVGYLEKKSNKYLNDKTKNAGSNNYTKYGAYFGINGPDAYWCDMFVDWCMVQAYGRDVAKNLLHGFSAYTPTSAQKFKDSDQWHKTPRIGDQIFFKNSQRICHTGIVYAVTDEMVFTIEGNTSNGTAVVPNGGAVCKKSYAKSNSRIAGYGRPAYDKVSVSYTTVKKTSSKSAIRWLQKKLNANCTYANEHPLAIDGIWGANTTQALKKYWKQLRWNTSGVYAGKKTCTALKKNRKK